MPVLPSSMGGALGSLGEKIGGVSFGGISVSVLGEKVLDEERKSGGKGFEPGVFLTPRGLDGMSRGERSEKSSVEGVEMARDRMSGGNGLEQGVLLVSGGDKKGRTKTPWARLPVEMGDEAGYQRDLWSIVKASFLRTERPWSLGLNLQLGCLGRL